MEDPHLKFWFQEEQIKPLNEKTNWLSILITKSLRVMSRSFNDEITFQEDCYLHRIESVMKWLTKFLVGGEKSTYRIP